jgi:hypothetical protein
MLHRELLLLRHVALQQAHAQLAGCAAELARAEQRRNQWQQQRQRGRQPAARPAAPPGRGCQRRQRRGDCADAADAEPRRPRRQRAVDLRITGGQPGEAGEDHGARQLGEKPGRGEQRHVDGRAAATAKREQRHRRRQVQRQPHAQQGHR